jgi:hypothetical protein
MGDNPSRILHEMIKEAKFGRSEFNELTVYPYLTSIEVDLEAVIYLDDIVNRLPGHFGAA